MRNLVKLFAVALCALSAAFIFETSPALANGRCIFCGSQAYGKDCPRSPYANHAHEHNDDYRHCIYCGSTAYGRTCYYAPREAVDDFMNTLATMLTGDVINGTLNYHRHGNGGGRCVFCGSQKSNTQCPNSEDKRHYY